MSSIQDTVSVCPAASSSGQGLRRSLCVPVNFGDERLPERFWSKVSPCPMSGCWIWVGANNGLGYGVLRVDRKNHYAHRFAYAVLVEPFGDATDTDHICRTPSCVNPAHLEAVSHRENMLRGDTFAAAYARRTRCPRGHEFTSDNTAIVQGYRRCRICRRADHAAWRAANAKRKEPR